MISRDKLSQSFAGWMASKDAYGSQESFVLGCLFRAAGSFRGLFTDQTFSRRMHVETSQGR